MAFNFKDAKIVVTDNLFEAIKSKMLCFEGVFAIYRTAKIADVFSRVSSEVEEEAQYYISGHVTEDNIPINRHVYCYRSDTGILMCSTNSSAISGYFYVETTYSGSHYVVCVDGVGGTDYNDLIYGTIYPVTISG